MHRIVVVGGGAGGLELVTRLGDRWGLNRRKPRAMITLVDINPAHLWKPLLHEVAAGSINPAVDQLEYMAQAQWHGFDFQQGALKGLDRTQRQITIDKVIDDMGVESLPERTLDYDTLILAIGSVTHFFNAQGAQAHSFALDTTYQAENFRRRLMTACLKKQQDLSSKPLGITIIGAGATGVELAAELHHTAKTLGKYGLNHLEPARDIQITLIEAAPRILPAMTESIANSTQRSLHKLAIEIKLNSPVTQVEEEAVHLKNGEVIPSHLTVWAAGIKAPSILTQLDGLAVNPQGQLLVHPTLQSVSDLNIFALGDCASCPQVGAKESVQIPPRAQAAHQQASFLLKQLKNRLNGREINKSFRYRDFGALIALGHTSAVGNLQSGVTTHGILVRGWVARWIYGSLYRLHIAALHGESIC